MRLQRVPLKIFLDEVTALERMLPDLREKAKDWTDSQNERENYGSVDQDYVSYQRSKLETALVEFRIQLATIYDFMGDKGLV